MIKWPAIVNRFVTPDLGDVCPIEAQCIRIQETYFFNVYTPPNKNVERYCIMSMLDIREPRSVKKIIVGDFNADHPTCGSVITNARGRHLLDTIDQLDLEVLNTT